MPQDRAPTRIQRRNRAAILNAALDVFSAEGFRGATVDKIAVTAGLSKPNLLYYFPSKEAMHTELLAGLLDTWLDPLRALDPDGDPLDELLGYVHSKLEMSRSLPRESRLFANEILQGAPRIRAHLETGLKPLFDEKCDLIQRWTQEGRLAEVDPAHLIFSIWAVTQHYADFEAQIGVLMPHSDRAWSDADAFLDTLFRKLLTP